MDLPRVTSDFPAVFDRFECYDAARSEQGDGKNAAGNTAGRIDICICNFILSFQCLGKG